MSDERMDANALLRNFRQWGEDRDIIKNSSPEAQFLKTVEEVGELASALAKGNIGGIEDSIGDTIVTLTLVASCAGLDIVQCMQSAWLEIKDRKGKLTPGGVFVKEGEPAEGKPKPSALEAKLRIVTSELRLTEASASEKALALLAATREKKNLEATVERQRAELADLRAKLNNLERRWLPRWR